MPTFTCPNCSHELAVTVVAAPVMPRSMPGATGPDVALVASCFAHVHGTYTTKQLVEMFESRRREKGWPALSTKALARALKADGWTSWRTRDERGWRR